MQIIDTHQHFWSFSPIEYDWIDGSMEILKQDYLPEHLAHIYQTLGITGCISVQATSSVLETKRLLEYADQNDFIKGVVGWVDFLDENVLDQIHLFKKHPKLKGLRYILQSENPDFISQPGFERGVSYLADLNLTYDILIYPKHLFKAYQLAEKFPKQKFVIDHAAKPMIKYTNYEDWKSLMQNFATVNNVSCKISGLVTEADWKSWKYKDFVPILDTVTEVFGKDRLMFGSDWPVCLLAGSYKNVLDIIKTYTDHWSPEDKEKIFSKNAIQFYNLV